MNSALLVNTKMKKIRPSVRAVFQASAKILVVKLRAPNAVTVGTWTRLVALQPFARIAPLGSTTRILVPGLSTTLTTLRPQRRASTVNLGSTTRILVLGRSTTLITLRPQRRASTVNLASTMTLRGHKSARFVLQVSTRTRRGQQCARVALRGSTEMRKVVIVMAIVFHVRLDTTLT